MHKKRLCVAEFRKRHVCLVLQGFDRCTVTASPQNTAHPQVGLINLARHCWSNKPEVAVWLSLFSTERSVSTKHCQSWLQPQEAASNPAEEFNPCTSTWGAALRRLFTCCFKDLWSLIWPPWPLWPNLHITLHDTSRTKEIDYTAKFSPTADQKKPKKTPKQQQQQQRVSQFNWFRLFCCLIAVGQLLSLSQSHVYPIALFLTRGVYSDLSSWGKLLNRLSPVPFGHIDPVYCLSLKSIVWLLRR